MRPHIICHMLSSLDGRIDGTVLKSAEERVFPHRHTGEELRIFEGGTGRPVLREFSKA